MRVRAFGPTEGFKSAGGGGRPGGGSALSRLLESDDEGTDYTALPRDPQAYEFNPLFPEPEPTGEEGGLSAPTGMLPSVPLETSGRRSRASLLSRLQESREGLLEAQDPGDVAEGFSIAGKGVSGAKTGLQGIKLFDRLLRDAGFTSGAIKQLLPAFNQISGGELAPEALNALAEQAGGSTEIISQLGEYAPYLSLLMAGLNVGQIASSGNLSDSQKAVAAIGPAVNAALTAAALAGSTAAGVFAGPIGMGVSFAIDHFLDMMQDVPHEVREGIDFNKLGADANLYRRSLDEAGSAKALYDLIVMRNNPRAGGSNAGPIYDADYRLNGERRVIGKGWGPYQGATLADLLAHPEAVGIRAQRGINPDMLAQVNEPLTNLIRNRLALFARAQAGDPQAILSVKLLAARGAAAKKMRAKEEAARRAAEEAESKRWAAEYNSIGGGE